MDGFLQELFEFLLPCVVFSIVFGAYLFDEKIDQSKGFLKGMLHFYFPYFVIGAIFSTFMFFARGAYGVHITSGIGYALSWWLTIWLGGCLSFMSVAVVGHVFFRVICSLPAWLRRR